MRVTINGTPEECAPGVSLADLVRRLVPTTTGLAAAVNAEVVPRAAWEATRIAAGDRVEILTAAQGG